MKYNLFTLTLIASSLIISSCGGTSTAENADKKVTPENLEEKTIVAETQPELIDEIDTHTLSNYRDARTKHLHLDLAVDFDRKIITGSVTHTIENINQANEIVFDTKGLNIINVTLNNGDSTTYSSGSYDELLGTALTVAITETTTEVTISYETTEKTEALDWLLPAQTAGKTKPFLYTQGQSIFTRSWIPLQDTPALRITYSAKIKVPNDLMAIMSASNPVTKNDLGVYEFNMPQPIPCYLLALAVGDLDFKSIDDRTGVYSEPSMLEDCVYELADMGKMVDAAEKLYGDYQWERFDVIVLPPSFPFGGMENPRLTFATPTIIAGDRSLVALIAHELAHSWSGNLVTNSNWNDFWLNEGFTVYFERRIMEDLFGKDYTDMLALLGYQDLEGTIASTEDAMQTLKMNLMSKHPDDGMSDIAYEKGYFFLRLLEESAGRDNFDIFLKTYFDTHKFQTITTEKFEAYLKENLLETYDLDVNVKEWIYEAGIPVNCPQVISTRFNTIDSSLEDFYSSNDATKLGDTKSWSTHEWLHFIRNLNDNTTKEQMALLDAEFQLTKSGNSEIAAIWFQRSINFGYEGIDADLEAFLIKIGRRKFLVPLYTALAETEKGKAKAIAIYEKARPNYHYVSYNTINALLGVNF